MNRATAIAGTAAVALICAIGAYFYWGRNTDNGYAHVPQFELPDLSGQSHSPSDWRGQVVVLNFWATWCPPCREEIPMLIQAQKELADNGVQIVGLAVDQKQPVAQFAQHFGINYPVLVSMHDIVRLQDALGGGFGLPYTVIVDRRGRVRARVAGRIDRERLSQLLAPLLE